MAPDASTSKSLIALSVDIEVLSSDQLKKCIFGIEKKKPSAAQVDWKINFQFLKRDTKTAEFVQRVKVSVDVSLENVPNTEKTAQESMTTKQKNFVNAVIAKAAEDFEAGKITKAEMQKLVERAVAAR